MLSVLIQSDDLFGQFISQTGFVENVTKLNAYQLSLILDSKYQQQLLVEKETNSQNPDLHLRIQLGLPADDSQLDLVDYQNNTTLMVSARFLNEEFFLKSLHQFGQINLKFETAYQILTKNKSNPAKADRLRKHILCEKFIRSAGRVDFDEQFVENVSFMLNKFYNKNDFTNEPAVDKIRDTLDEKLSQFQVQNQEFCHRVDQLIKLNELENEAENYVLAKIFMYQEDQLMLNPMMYAAMTNNFEAVKLLSPKFLCTSCPKTKITSLMIALRLGYKEIATYLIDEKQMYTRLNVTPFVGALAGGLYQLSKQYFIEQKDIPDSTGKSALHQAIISGNEEAFADTFNLVRLPIGKSWNPLDAAVSYNRNKFAFQLIPFYAGYSNDSSALTFALKAKNKQLVELLVKFEGGLQYGIYKSFALYAACQLGEISAIPILMKYETGLANAYNMNAIFGAFQNVEALKLVINDPFKDYRESPLESAIQARMPLDTIQILVQRFGHIVDQDGFTFLEQMISHKTIYEVQFKFAKYNLIRAWHLAKIQNYEFGMEYIQKLLGLEDYQTFQTYCVE